jgi:hypothetical protein
MAWFLLMDGAEAGESDATSGAMFTEGSLRS